MPAAEIHITPSRATSSNGLNLDGAKWFFYQTGTTTPQSVYTTAALNVAHANPVVADAAGKFAPIYFDSGLQYRGVLKSADEATTIYDIDPINAGVFAGLAASGGAALVSNVLPAGSNLRTHTLAELANSGVLQLCQFSGASEEVQLVNALTEATATRDGGQGQTVLIPRGEIETTTPFNIPNRAALSGVNKRGSRIVADAAFSGSYMATVVNGTASMFDNPMCNLTLDCNDVAGLSGIDSQAWQEGGGLRNVLIEKFRVYGIRIRDGFGGAALMPIDNAEIFASSVAVATAGIFMDEISAVGNFVLSVKNTTIAGPAAFPLPRGIDIVNDSSNMETVHFEDTVNGIYLDGAGDHVLENVTGGPGVTTVIRIASTFTGTLRTKGCRRAGATNLLVDERTNGLGTVAWDTDITILEEPPIGPYPIARGTFNGTSGNFNTNWAKGYASVNRTGTGVYEFTLSRALPNVNMLIPHVTCRGADLANPNVQRLGTSSFRVTLTTTSGTPADSDEMGVTVFGFN